MVIKQSIYRKYHLQKKKPLIKEASGIVLFAFEFEFGPWLNKW